MPLELVYYGYPQSTYWTGSFKVFSDQRSHIHGPNPGHHSSFKYQYKSFQACFQQIRGSYSRKLSRLTYCSVRNFTSDAWPAQFSCFPLGINVHDFYSSAFESILFWFHLAGIRLGRVHWNTIRMVGWALCPTLILCWYRAFCVPMFLSGLVPLCSWIHSALFCTQAFEFAITMRCGACLGGSKTRKK